MQRGPWSCNIFHCLQPASIPTSHKIQLTAQCDMRVDKSIKGSDSIAPSVDYNKLQYVSSVSSG